MDKTSRPYKTTYQERLKIGKALYEKETTYEEVIQKYGIGRDSARLYMRLYRNSNNLPIRYRESYFSDREHREASSSLDRLAIDPSEPYQSIANAIVAVAADDYRYALQKNNKKLLKELEEFFFSDYFKILSKAKPRDLLDALKLESAEKLDVVYI